MTKDVINCTPEDSLDKIMSAMTAGRFRHVPVVEAGQLVGIISIGDVVRAVVDEQKFTISSLERYMMTGG